MDWLLVTLGSSLAAISPVDAVLPDLASSRAGSCSSFPSWTLSGGAKAPSVTTDVLSSYRSNELDPEKFWRRKAAPSLLKDRAV
jgi:L-alanine-DL-glutamate epimerase-like enolase superfamily enzyme